MTLMMIIKKILNIESENNLLMVLKSILFIYLLSTAVLLIGLNKYYIRHRKDHNKNWDIIKFIFGNNKCNI